MKKTIFLIVLLSLYLNLSAQELNCSVVVSTDKIVDADPKVFKTLERAIDEFVNQTKWTQKEFEPEERIECSIVLTLNEKTGSNFYSGSIQVQSSRPVFNSIYNTPVLNYKDDNLSFSYIEFEPLQYDVNAYQSELISTLSYFVYLIIGMDADTFDLNGGDEYFNICQNIMDQVDSPNDKKAWQSNTNKFNRFHLINKILSPTYDNFRSTYYNYHLKGMDGMADNQIEAKNNIKIAIMGLEKVAEITMGTQLSRIFMDAKADEITNIFTEGPQMDTDDLVQALYVIAPTMANKWEKIEQ